MISSQPSIQTIGFFAAESVAPPSYSRSLTADELTLERRLSYSETLSSVQTEEAPPDYTYVDDSATHFSISTPFIYSTTATATKNIRYQLYSERTRSGKPWKLHIRRLLDSESRRYSIAVAEGQDDPASYIDYDLDSTMYTIENLSVVGARVVQIQGHRRNCYKGFIRVERCLNGKWKFWHCTRNPRRDSLDEENRRDMEKYGYRPNKEWFKDLLLIAEKRGKRWEWKNIHGILKATEEGGEIKLVAGVGRMLRDVIITCWTTRSWTTQGLGADLSQGKKKEKPATRRFSIF